MLPVGTEIRVEDEVLYWENRAELATESDARLITDQLVETMTHNLALKGMIVDNRLLEKGWSPVFDRVWMDLLKILPLRELKAATIYQDVIQKLQFNYLSSQAGTSKTVKGFVGEELKELCDFLEVQNVHLTTLQGIK